MEDGLSISELKNIINIVIDTGVVPIVEGPPGVGKSSVVREIAANLPYTIQNNVEVSKVSKKLRSVYGSSHTGLVVKDVRLGLCSPTEIKGIPVFDTRDGDALWVNTSLFPIDPSVLARKEAELLNAYTSFNSMDHTHPSFDELKNRITRLEAFIEKALHEQFALLFLDEITQAPISVQNAAFSLVLDRTIGTYSLPEKVLVIAAGNRKKDLAGANTLNSALTSRFIKLTLDNPTMDDFTSYAIKNGIDPEILGFLEFKKELLFDFNPSNVGMSFPCPRTWEFASRQLKAWKEKSGGNNELYHLVGGCVGYATSMMFVNWRNLYVKLPNPKDILDGKIKRKDIDFQGIAESSKEKHKVHGNDLSLIHAFTMSMIVMVAEEYTDQRLTNFLKFLCDTDSSKLEWATIAIKTFIINYEELSSTKLVNNPEWKNLIDIIDIGNVLTQ